MKIKIRNKITELMSPLKNDMIYIDIDKDEKLLINHKGSVRKILIEADSYGDINVTKPFIYLKTAKEIKGELMEA